MKIANEKMLIEYLNKNDIRLIALDLDRTTLRSDSTLAPRTRSALEAAIGAGLEVVVISGRPRCSLPDAVLDIPGIRYLVTSNGAAVNKRFYPCEEDASFEDVEKQKMWKHDCTRDETGTKKVIEKRVWAWTLEPQAALSILKHTLPFFNENRLTYEAFVEGTAYAPENYVNHPTKYGTPEHAVPYVQNTRIPVADFPAFIREHAGKLDSFDMIIGEQSCFREVKAFIAENVSNIYMTSSMERMLEISSKDAGKASGLRYVLDELGLEPGHAIAFGDGDNDADMLTFAGLGVAMANAMPLCLKSADYIGKSNDEDGVAEILEFLLSGKTV